MSDNPKSIVSILDKELRIKMGKLGRVLIEEKFNWDTIAKQFLKLAS